jgi:hypothetical protein
MVQGREQHRLRKAVPERGVRQQGEWKLRTLPTVSAMSLDLRIAGYSDKSFLYYETMMEAEGRNLSNSVFAQGELLTTFRCGGTKRTPPGYLRASSCAVSKVGEPAHQPTGTILMSY